MTAKDAIRQSLMLGDMIVTRYLEDLSDADLLLQPVEGMNTIAWQLGHVIATERAAMEGIEPGSSPALPSGFAENHGRDMAGSTDRSKFATKAEYLKLWEAQRSATRALLDRLSDEQLDAPGPERFRQMAPTVGAVMVMMGQHILMHVGQFVAVRRKLKKPIAI